MARVFRFAVHVGLCQCLLFAACQKPSLVDRDGRATVSSYTHSLAEGREVQVVPVTGLPYYEHGAPMLVDPRSSIAGFQWQHAPTPPGQRQMRLSWLDLVVASCDVQARTLYGDAGQSGMFVTGSLPNKRINVKGYESNVWLQHYSAYPWVTQALLLCAGHRALELAQALTTTYMVGYFPNAGEPAERVIATDTPDAWPDVWEAHKQLLKSMPQTSSHEFPEWSDKFQVLFEIPPSDSAQAATWSLIAVDLFRQSALMGAEAFIDQEYQRGNGGLRPQHDYDLIYGQLPSGKRITLEEVVVGALSDALTGLDDAAHRAELYVAAATSDIHGATTRTEGWRGRFGSRLEAARVFAAIDPTLFEGHGLVPLYEMVGKHATTGTEHSVTTTHPASVEAFWEGTEIRKEERLVVGYVYSPALPQPPGTRPLFRNKATRGLQWLTFVRRHAEDKDALPLITSEHVPSTEGYKGVADILEGYVPLSRLDGTTLDLSIEHDSASNQVFRVAKEQSTAAGRLAVFGVSADAGSESSNIEPPHFVGKYPVVSQLADNRNRRAEAAIRSLRIAPAKCTAETGCDLSQSNEHLFDDMRRAHGGATSKAELFGDNDTYAKKMGFDESDAENAAKRIRQEAAVLGRAIVPGTEEGGVLRVRGTLKTFRPVEPVYLQALTDGSAAFASDGTGSVLDKGKVLDSEFAGRGIYQALLYVHENLAGHYHSKRRGVDGALKKLFGWIRTQVDGYVRVEMTVDEGAGNTLEILIRELVPGPGTFEVWAGEEGLECALSGAVAGATCKEEEYRLARKTLSGQDSEELGAEAVALSSASIRSRHLVSGTRLYLTKSAGVTRRGLAGFTFASETDKRRLPLLSQVVADAYARTLAADPSESYRAEKQCNGLIDADVRVKLEDELSGDSALKYALSRARVAADRADALGEHVVASGLALDDRSEIARDNLEQLCGAVVDFRAVFRREDTGDRVEDESGDEATDFVGVVEGKNPLPAGLSVSAGSNGLAACTAEEEELVWLSVGEVAHCVWQMNGEAPCECGSDLQCNEWWSALPVERRVCPVSPSQLRDAGIEPPKRADTAGSQTPAPSGGANPACTGWYLPSARATVASNAAMGSQERVDAPEDMTFRSLETAGHKIDSGSAGSIYAADLPADPLPGWEDAGSRCEMLAALYSGAYRNKSVGEIRAAFPWLDFDSVRDVAKTIGVRVDHFGLYELTFDGEHWLKVGSLGPLAPPAKPGNASWGGAEGSSVDRRKWDGVSEGWDVSKRAALKVCHTSRDDEALSSAETDFLYCMGPKGGIRDALRVEMALETLAHLTGAEGPRDFWEWSGKAETLGKKRKKVGQVHQIGVGDPRYGAFEGVAIGPQDILFGATKNESLLVATDLRSDQNGAGFEIPKGVDLFLRDGVVWGPRGYPAPWNWRGAAAFKQVHEDANVDKKFDAETFLTRSALWDLLRTPDGLHGQGILDWGYRKGRGPWTHKTFAYLLGAGKDAFPAGKVNEYGVRLGPWLLSRWLNGNIPMTRADVFDAFSLVCKALDDRDGAGLLLSVDGCASYLSTAEDSLTGAASAADCVARRVGRQLDELYVPGVPQRLVGTLMASGDSLPQILPDFSGEYAEAVSALASDIEIYRGGTAAVSRALSDMGYQARLLERAIDRMENESAIVDLNLRKDVANQVTDCITAVANAWGVGAGKYVAAGATCANSAVQIAWSSKIEELKQENIELTQAQQLDDFKEAVDDNLARIDQQMLATRQAHARIHGDLARMQRIRASARSALARAAVSEDLGNGRVNAMNAVMRARMNTALHRYEEAWRQAVRHAFLARRTIEQRLGVELDMMTQRMSLFGDRSESGLAPYEWADSICDKRGVDYEEIRLLGRSRNDGGDAAEGAKVEGEAPHYAKSYVGDYVTRLEDFLASYRVDFPFQEGSDSVVVSVRDELQGVRRLDCSVEGHNLLFNTSEPRLGSGAWGCRADTPCASLLPLGFDGQDEAVSEAPFFCGEQGCADPWRVGVRPVVLGPAEDRADVKPVTEQVVYLEPAQYSVSWYEETGAGLAGVGVRVRFMDRDPRGLEEFGDPDESVVGLSQDVAVDAPFCEDLVPSADDQETWRRCETGFRVRGGHWVGVGLELNQPTGQPQAHAVFAAPQLEVGDRATGYFPTDQDLEAPVGVCEDADGSRFRSWDIWSYGCEAFCPAGLGTDCQARVEVSTLPQTCYYETRFHLSQEDIERGRLLQEAGFSKGNFNYRIKRLAVNFVGANLKVCEGAELSRACYGGHFLQYSLHHTGPFRVRNYEGDLYSAPLFDGRIQMAKGLAAERFLSNPMSTADRGMLGDYYRSELRERPLEGQYVLRVYDTEHLNWSNLEDVQLAIDYGYWTRTPGGAH